jgi:hypothetical protein
MTEYRGLFRPWNLMKAEIKSWLKTKELEFAQKDNKKLEVNTAQISRQVCV